MALESANQDTSAKGVSRRGFLTGVGAAAGAAGAAALGPADAAAQLLNQQQVAERARTDRFTRIFDRLPSFAEPTDDVKAALRELGAPGGLLDAQDPLLEGPTRLITNPELSPRNIDNAAHTAGVTFFGQFLDHDMTFDTTSQLGVPTRPERAPNARTPGLDLDSVYGRGPMEDVQLYERGDRSKLRVEPNRQFEDLPRIGGQDGDHRRPTQRREHDDRRAARRDAEVPQSDRRYAARRG